MRYFHNQYGCGDPEVARAINDAADSLIINVTRELVDLPKHIGSKWVLKTMYHWINRYLSLKQY